MCGSLTEGVLPLTHVLPDPSQTAECILSQSDANCQYIFKPSSGSCGRGIQLISRDSVAATIASSCDNTTGKGAVLQQYIEPMLIANRKFDLRLYVLVPSISPLRVYLHSHGLVRFAACDYETDLEENSRYRHLTNYSVSRRFALDPNSPIKQLNHGDGQGRKWDLSDLTDYLDETHGRQYRTQMTQTIEDQICRTVLSVRNHLQRRATATAARQCYELYGFDVMIDKDGKPWLLEVNVLPSMQFTSLLDWTIKRNVTTDMLDMLCIRKPEESPRHSCTKPLSVLQDFEDEFNSRNGFNLIYPRPITPSFSSSHDNATPLHRQFAAISNTNGDQIDTSLDDLLHDWHKLKHVENKDYSHLTQDTVDALLRS
eukprot:TRINITY_DN66724_c6_g5_i2.p1 TRINITY_DN66724_c6_g5~~TRINITY_DN66724_c6_g5_i2.p1  ORF type:complete len:371 (+),score=13.13 TRINITY_DN66724_c6_g5_i2:458-1570(+)